MKFSVLVPIYNAAAWLRQTIDSVLRQKCGDFELLLYDDGSTDGSADIMRSAQEADGRVKLLGGGDNLGSMHARLALAGAMIGDYALYLDADDLLDPDALSTGASFMSAHSDSGLVRLCWDALQLDGRRNWVHRMVGGAAESPAECLDLWLRSGVDNRSNITHQFIRRDVLARSLPPDARQRPEDMFFSLPANLEAGVVRQLDSKPLYTYRRQVGYWDSPGQRSLEQILQELYSRRDQMVWYLAALHRHGLQHRADEVLKTIDKDYTLHKADGLGEDERRRCMDVYDKWFTHAPGGVTGATIELLRRALDGDTSWFGDRGDVCE